MNNRIQALAEQAGLLGPSSRGGNAHEAAEKFAELIIAECAKACVPTEQEPLTEWLVCPKCSYKSPYSPIKAKTLAEDAERITKQTRAALAQTEDEDYDALSQKHLASIKRDTQVSLEDATVRATHKVMAELEREALAQPEQEPVGVIQHLDELNEQWTKHLPIGTKLYDTPPKRTWVGLTDDELLKTYGWEFVSYGQSDRPSLGPSILDEAKQEIIDGLRKVEALLKEKNHD